MLWSAGVPRRWNALPGRRARPSRRRGRQRGDGRHEPRPGRRLAVRDDPGRQISRRLRVARRVNAATSPSSETTSRRLFRRHYWRRPATDLAFFVVFHSREHNVRRVRGYAQRRAGRIFARGALSFGVLPSQVTLSRIFIFMCGCTAPSREFFKVFFVWKW